MERKTLIKLIISYCSFPDKMITCLITSFLRYFKIHFVFWGIRTFVLVLMKSTKQGTWNVDCFRLKNTCILCSFSLEWL